jgi:hypothetical protein
MKTLKMLSIASVVLFMIVMMISCRKSGLLQLTEDATIVYKGAPAADGAGWLVVTANDSTYSPANLSSQYQTNNLKVHMVFRKLIQRFYTGMATQSRGITEINIDDMSLR